MLLCLYPNVTLILHQLKAGRQTYNAVTPLETGVSFYGFEVGAVDHFNDLLLGHFLLRRRS